MINLDDIRNLKTAVEQKYKGLFSKLEIDKRKELEAIDIVYKIQKSFAGNTLVDVNMTDEKQIKQPQGGSASKIRDAIKRIGTDFDLNVISEFLKVDNPAVKVTRGNFHAAIRLMVANGEAIIVSQGKGKKATIYRYVKENQYNNIRVVRFDERHPEGKIENQTEVDQFS